MRAPSTYLSTVGRVHTAPVLFYSSSLYHPATACVRTHAHRRRKRENIARLQSACPLRTKHGSSLRLLHTERAHEHTAHPSPPRGVFVRLCEARTTRAQVGQRRTSSASRPILRSSIYTYSQHTEDRRTLATSARGYNGAVGYTNRSHHLSRHRWQQLLTSRLHLKRGATGIDSCKRPPPL